MIPTGFSGLLTGILLAIGRVMGETAPLMLTALGSSVINLNIAKPTSAVPLLIWEFYNDPNMVDLIWSSSLLLMIIVLSLNVISKQIARGPKINKAYEPKYCYHKRPDPDHRRPFDCLR
jgi:phosphate transport system permease protein